MESLEYYKQLDDMVLDEINAKEYHRPVGITEDGELSFVYVREERKYYFRFPHRQQEVKDETTLLIMQNVWKEIKKS